MSVVGHPECDAIDTRNRWRRIFLAYSGEDRLIDNSSVTCAFHGKSQAADRGSIHRARNSRILVPVDTSEIVQIGRRTLRSTAGLHGIAVQAAAGASRDELRQIAALALHAWAWPA
jgi:hypothetical protein